MLFTLLIGNIQVMLDQLQDKILCFLSCFKSHENELQHDIQRQLWHRISLMIKSHIQICTVQITLNWKN